MNNINILNETFDKHLKLLKDKLNIKEISSQLQMPQITGHGDDIFIGDYFNSIWEEISELKTRFPSYDFSDCLKESPTFNDFFGSMVSVDVDITDIDFDKCPDLGDELDDIERKKYNNIVKNLYNKWSQTFDSNDIKPSLC